uniref:Transmembrane protein 179 n=1 Tax=Strigamia maritima TaxID=126957 RepID=T1JIJ6_STRMM
MANYLLLSQLIVYVFIFALSLCLSVPVSIHLNNFRGHCLLFSSGNWSNKGQLMVEWSSSFYCSYVIFVGGILLISSLIQIYRLSIFLYKGVDSSFLSAFIDTITSTLLSIMSLAAAIFITLGFKAWCDAITTRYISCKDASSSDMDEKANIIIPGFYIQIGTAQFAAWSAWVCSVALAVFSFLKICQYHQRANIVASMAKERQRLVRDPYDKSHPIA